MPYVDEVVLDAIRYAGNTSLREDVEKLVNSGLAHRRASGCQLHTGLPIFYECEVVDTEYLGTHVIVFGQVTRIRVADDVSERNSLERCPWPDVV